MKSNLMKKTFGILTLGTLGLMATGAQADWERGDHRHGHNPAVQQSYVYSQQVNARQDRQMERIQIGRRQGHLTHGEFNALMQKQYAIRAMEQHFRSDGVIDTHEFQRLNRALDIASHTILVENHDRQAGSAYGYHPRFN
jgi:uncharacterized membrane protein YebE (DUF533 family)